MSSKHVTHTPTHLRHANRTCPRPAPAIQQLARHHDPAHRSEGAIRHRKHSYTQPAWRTWETSHRSPTPHRRHNTRRSAHSMQGHACRPGRWALALPLTYLGGPLSGKWDTGHRTSTRDAERPSRGYPPLNAHTEHARTRTTRMDTHANPASERRLYPQPPIRVRGRSHQDGP